VKSLAFILLVACGASDAAPRADAIRRVDGAVPRRAAAPAAPDAGAPAGRPVCVRVGTRSEGWAWPDGRFIHWAKCKGVVPTCQSGSDGEGWYARGAFIAAARCQKKR
jgi:hypothetical protein